jgi:hypothetical protein
MSRRSQECHLSLRLLSLNKQPGVVLRELHRLPDENDAAHSLSMRGRIFMRRAPDRGRALGPEPEGKPHSIHPVKPDSEVWHKA